MQVLFKTKYDDDIRFLAKTGEKIRVGIAIAFLVAAPLLLETARRTSTSASVLMIGSHARPSTASRRWLVFRSERSAWRLIASRGALASSADVVAEAASDAARSSALPPLSTRASSRAARTARAGVLTAVVAIVATRFVVMLVPYVSIDMLSDREVRCSVVSLSSAAAAKHGRFAARQSARRAASRGSSRPSEPDAHARLCTTARLSSARTSDTLRCRIKSSAARSIPRHASATAVVGEIAPSADAGSHAASIPSAIAARASMASAQEAPAARGPSSMAVARLSALPSSPPLSSFSLSFQASIATALQSAPFALRSR